ncbi:hypothetical protein [Robertkochia solimangrovi]|uniref:hypothetical protein n=1 Tax=Robertkochia solimangrovi TaxID=2213046 RepID=UPI00117DF390|nr:hypothetical protein [Robertkochia solimangrovi]TRZ43095.1 hypothetical protein DMZ48_10385 [Robertkochia solimangrovi]
MILIFRYIFPYHYVGLTIWPLIILREASLRDDKVLINHERIHLRQQVELLIIPFYLIYFMEYIFGLLKYRSSILAYRNISFEKEAYANEYDLEYLEKRNFWTFLKYYRS